MLTCSLAKTTLTKRLMTFKVISFCVASTLRFPASTLIFACCIELVIWFPAKIVKLVLALRFIFPIRRASKRLVTGLIDLPQLKRPDAEADKDGNRCPLASSRLASLLSWFNWLLLSVRLFSTAMFTASCNERAVISSCCAIRIGENIRNKITNKKFLLFIIINVSRYTYYYTVAE